MKVFLVVPFVLALKYAITFVLSGILLWLISLVLPYTFSWLHAFVLSGVLMILDLLFGRRSGGQQ